MHSFFLQKTVSCFHLSFVYSIKLMLVLIPTISFIFIKLLDRCFREFSQSFRLIINYRIYFSEICLMKEALKLFHSRYYLKKCRIIELSAEHFFVKIFSIALSAFFKGNIRQV